MSETERLRMMCRDTLEPVREIARQLFADYDNLDPVRDSHIIYELIQRASRLKYEHLGIVDKRPSTSDTPRFPHLIGKGIMYLK